MAEDSAGIRAGAPSGRSVSALAALGTSASIPKLILSLSVLVISATASLIAWERFDPEPPKTLPQAQAVQSSKDDLETFSLRLAELERDNQKLRAELDGLMGTGGVLPRIIERLSEGKRVEAAHRASIDQLFLLIARLEGARTQQAQGLVSDNGAPVSVTSFEAAGSDRPVRVIVTPKREPQTPVKDHE